MKIIYSLIIAILIPTFSFAGQVEVASSVEKYLNGLTSLTADFSQSDSEGNLSGGKFYLKRPGKFKWEYDKRQPLLIVSDGKQLVYYDKTLKEVTYASTKDTLANFLSKPVIKFSGDVKLISATRTKNLVTVVVTQKSKPEEGKLRMYFAANPMQIIGLDVIDQYENTTKISFRNIISGSALANDLFVFKNPKFGKNVWEKK